MKCLKIDSVDYKLSEKDKQVLNFLEKVPKTEIHLHLEACVGPDIIWQLIQKNKIPLQKTDLRAKYKFRNLNEFIDLFLFIQSTFYREEDLTYCLVGLKEYLLKQRIVYAEIFFSPSRFVQKGFDFGKMVEVLVQGVRDIKKEYGLEIRIIFDVSRTFGVENTMRNLKQILRYRQSEIIGIGMGGAERKNPSKQFQKVFQEAQASGLKTVVHTGEDLGPEEIWSSLEYLKPHRIGHAVSAVLDNKLMDYLKEHQIPVEVCVSSNVLITDLVQEIKDHPVKKFYKKGLLVSINTDDPEIFKTNLNLEYFKIYKFLDFKVDDLIVLIKNGVSSTFYEDKTLLLDIVDKEIKKLNISVIE